MTSQERGAAAETQVLQLLIGRGWQLLDRNWRRRLGRALDCWRSLHPDRADCLLQVAVALVPLPPSRGRVRWFLLERLC